MTVIAVVSMKGGVGKTSTTANLGAALALQGRRVTVLDLDPQNSLFLHFGIDTSLRDGLATAAAYGSDWRQVMHASDIGVSCLPYGVTTAAERDAFELLLEHNPGWIGERLSEAGVGQGSDIVLVDTPPGPSIYLREAFACSDLALMVLLADAGSYATIPAMESWVAEWAVQRPELQTWYLLNQVDIVSSLYRDVAEVLRQRLARRLAPVGIHRDEAVCEALAVQQSVLTYDPYGQATQDYRQLAAWLAGQLDR